MSITIVMFLGFYYFSGNSNNSNIIHHYQKDSVFYRQRDSINLINDTIQTKINKIEKTYEKKVEIIKYMPIDSAYIFWADYIQRYKLDNDSSTIENN